MTFSTAVADIVLPAYRP